jgi:hypothetical protein
MIAKTLSERVLPVRLPGFIAAFDASWSCDIAAVIAA